MPAQQFDIYWSFWGFLLTNNMEEGVSGIPLSHFFPLTLRWNSVAVAVKYDIVKSLSKILPAYANPRKANIGALGPQTLRSREAAIPVNKINICIFLLKYFFQLWANIFVSNFTKVPCQDH